MPFYAIAELIENATHSSVNAKQLWIDVAEINEEICLTFTDNGNGMTPLQLERMLSFSPTAKVDATNHLPSVKYGYGFKSGSMRLGKDILVFTKNGGALSVGLLSQTFHEQEDITVPIVTFSQQSKKMINSADSAPKLEAILRYSVFKTEQEVLASFDAIPSKKGTRIVIWNLQRYIDEKPELDFDADIYDIQTRSYKKEHFVYCMSPGPIVQDVDSSFREFCSLLYLRPRMQIYLRKKKVMCRLISKRLGNTKHDSYKPSFTNKRVRLIFGMNRLSNDYYGVMMYNNNRLIKAYQKVGCQLRGTPKMPKCMVDGCCNRQSRSGNKGNFMLHRFPTSKKTIKSWLIATGRDFDDIDSVVQNVIESRKFGTYRMCSQHFDDHCYVNTGKQRILKANSVPTIFHYKKSMGNKVSNTPIPEDTPSTSASDAQSVAPSTKQSVSATIGLLTDVINEQPRKRKRFMDHDYTEESEHYAFAKFVSEGCNTECVPTKDKSSSTGERFARRSIKLQTQPSLFSANVKTTTRDLIMVKNCGTMTDDLIWPGISNFTPGGQTQVKSQQKKPHSTLTKAKLKTPKVFRRPFSLCSTPIKEKTTVPNIEESGCAEDDRDLQFDIDQTMHEESGHEVDPTYCPSTLTDSYLGELSFLSEPTPEDFVAEQKFLVFESALDELLRKITNCSYKGCSAFIVERKKKITGTLLTVKGVCENEHETDIWKSQPIVKGRAAGNLLASAAVLFSGSHFLKVEEMYKLLGMPFIHKTTHYDYQKEYFFPVIDKHYQADHESNIRDLKGEPVCVCGDGQCDSPGHSAKYCTYTMMDEETNKILDCNTVQVSEATSSSAMEATAFKQTMAKLKDDGVKIAMLATDRHVTIRSLMAKLFKSIEHQFDVWHFCKSLFQKLRALCRKRKCKEITAWCRSIVNHMWTCCATSQGNVALLKERWNSILHHIVGEHSWDNGCLVSGCAHDPIDAGVGRPKKWLKKDSVAFGELSKLVLDKKLQKDLDHLAEFCHTGNLEIFHSLVLKYRPKRVHFGMDAMVARTRLAVLAHNNNVNKTQATVQNVDGTESVDVNRYKAYFCKRNKQWMIKKIYNANTISHIYPMLADVIRHASGELTSQWVSKNKSYPKNVATVPCPVKADLVDKHRSRFK